jgi:m7GpppX diphosphatase
MSNPAAPKSLSDLEKFTFERVLNEDPLTHTLILLGTFPRPEPSDEPLKAVIRIEKTALNPGDGPRFFGANGIIKRVEVEGSTDIVR